MLRSSLRHPCSLLAEWMVFAPCNLLLAALGVPRYKDMAWVRTQRRWPPALADALQAFLTLSAAPAV
jgi:hypothetical protein